MCLSVFPWAPFRSTKAAVQAAHALGFAGQYPVLHLHQRRQTWKTFLQNHAEAIAAIDMCVVPALNFDLLFASLVLGHGQRPTSAQRIVLFSESLGTAVAFALAAEREIGALILDAPFTSAADVGAAAYPFAPVRWVMKDSLHSDERIARVSVPLLVLHGERDTMIPIAFGERLFALAREPKRMVRFPDGGHVDLDEHGAVTVWREFLAELR